MKRQRIATVAVAAALLAAASPLLLILGAVNLLLTGRLFFRQVRLGQDLRPFEFLKFQTMVEGAHRGSTVTTGDDRRITPYGRVLRRLKLDELPQLINVLRGEMALVGPRPLTPNEVAAMPRHLASVIYRAAPGITGISALAFANEERLLATAADPQRAYFEEILPRKVALELAYAGRRTRWTDALVLAVTPLAAFLPAVRRRVLVVLVPEWERLRPAAADPLRGGRPGLGMTRR